MTACTPRYTCKQARTHCSECLLPASGIKEVPFAVMDRPLPLSCVILLKRIPYINKVFKTGNAGKDTREVAQSYRKMNDDNISLEGYQAKCAEDLKELETDIKASAEAYCKNMDLMYSLEKQACIAPAQ